MPTAHYADLRHGQLATGLAGPAANLALMFFNLLPIPPLDGSSVLPLFLSNRGLYTYYRL